MVGGNAKKKQQHLSHLSDRSSSIYLYIYIYTDHLHHFAPNLILRYVVQDMRCTDSTQEACARSCG